MAAGRAGTQILCRTLIKRRNNKMQNEINMLEDMIELLTATRTDYSKFYDEGNGAAGTRLRKVMQEVKTSAQTLRTHVQETKNA
tara:strand:+ start:241 stop:492 length:252 start_codon:yes stop_codon:yes gene_type:complete